MSSHLSEAAAAAAEVLCPGAMLPWGRWGSPRTGPPPLPWPVGQGDTCDGGARWSLLWLPPAPPLSCLVLGSFGAVWAVVVLAGSVMPLV